MSETKVEHTPGRLAIPAANVFRVIAPDAPHNNKKEGWCSPYPWAIVCDVCPESTSGEEAHANARRIVSCWNACIGIAPEAVPKLLEACKRTKEILDAWGPERRGHTLELLHERLTDALTTATTPASP